MDERTNRSGFIPRRMMVDKSISNAAKLIYCEMTAHMDKDGEVNLGKRDLAELTKYKSGSISKAIRKLIDRGYIKSPSIEEIDFLKLMNKKSLRGLGKGKYICEWCEINTNVIDEHHYPVPKKDGGKETVNICPNCHYEYHRFEGKYFINEDEEMIAWMYEKSNEQAFRTFG